MPLLEFITCNTMPRSFVALLIGVGITLAACAPAAQPAAPTTVPTPTAGPAKKIGVAYSNLIADSLSLWVARESGIFAKNGLDVDLQYITGSSPGLARTACFRSR